MEKVKICKSNVGKKQPLKITENISVFAKKTPLYFPQGLIRCDKITKQGSKRTDNVGGGVRPTQYRQEFTNYPRNILEFASEGKTFHSTQKPVALLEYLLKTYTNEGDIVLDNCMGSGSTGVACVNTNRRFIGIELDKKYYEIAKQRINDAVFSLQ